MWGHPGTRCGWKGEGGASELGSQKHPLRREEGSSLSLQSWEGNRWGRQAQDVLCQRSHPKFPCPFLLPAQACSAPPPPPAITRASERTLSSEQTLQCCSCPSPGGVRSSCSDLGPEVLGPPSAP